MPNSRQPLEHSPDPWHRKEHVNFVNEVFCCRGDMKRRELNVGYPGWSWPGGSPSPTELTVLRRNSRDTVWLLSSSYRYITFSLFFFLTSSIVAKRTHRWESRRAGLANGSELEELRRRAASVMTWGRWMINCKRWLKLWTQESIWLNMSMGNQTHLCMKVSNTAEFFFFAR